MITKLARNLGQQPGPRAAAVAALLPLGVRSRSESHASDLAGRPVRGGRPIVVMGTPRGGTTTVLRVLGRALQAPAVFEPFGFNHLELATFSAANESFSLGLPIEESRQRWRGGYAPHCCDLYAQVHGRSEALAVLQDHLAALHEAVGEFAVWKEIRLLPALPAVRAAYAKLGLEPRFVLVRCHPLGVLYSYYRMAALGQGPGPYGRSVGHFLEVREDAYQQRWDSFELARPERPSPAQNIVLGALADLEAIRRYESESPMDVHCIELGSDIRQLVQDMGLEASEEDGEPRKRREPAWARDALFASWLEKALTPDILEAIESAVGSPPCSPDQPRARQRVTRVLNWLMGAG